MDNRTSKLYSSPLMRQTFRANLLLSVVILVVMCLISVVINYAMSIMGTETTEGVDEAVQEDFFAYMYVLASYNQLTDQALSYEDFNEGSDTGAYEAAFDLYNGQKADEEEALSVSGFEAVIDDIDSTDADIETYIRQFEYAYALTGQQGCFSGDELDMEDLMETMFAAAGISQADLDKMKDLDMTTYFNKMYFTVIGVLPIFVWAIVVANALIAAQVDKGSMAYILSTPTRRSSVAVTQALYMIGMPLVMVSITCAVRIVSTKVIFGEVHAGRILILYLGMYLVAEAVSGICYMFSCIFDQSKKAMAAGGGLTMWFFLAALLGTFGKKDMIDMGMGAEVLGVFNKLTIVSLFDADAVHTIGTAEVDLSFIPMMAVLAVIAAACYIIGCVRFCKKDLPL